MQIDHQTANNRKKADTLFRLALTHVITEPKHAIRLLKKAASMGHADAFVSLGGFYRDGHGVRADWRRSKWYFERSVAMGSREGMTSLARLLLERGRGAKERRQAVHLLEVAFRRGDWAASHFLGRAAEDSGNWPRAERWYRLALRKGDIASGLRIARHYLEMMHMQSQARGVLALREIIRKSDIVPIWAFTEMGKCYLYGRGVNKSVSKSRRYLVRAVHDPEASHLLQMIEKKLASPLRSRPAVSAPNR